MMTRKKHVGDGMACQWLEPDWSLCCVLGKFSQEHKTLYSCGIYW